jgi:hypothetical protein
LAHRVAEDERAMGLSNSDAPPGFTRIESCNAGEDPVDLMHCWLPLAPANP